MASINISLDQRKAKLDGTFPLKISIAHNSQTAYENLSIYLLPSQWSDQTRQVVDHPRKQIMNATIRRKLLDMQQGLLAVEDKLGKDMRSISAKDLRDMILKYNDSGDLSLKPQRIKEWFDAKMKGITARSTRTTYNAMWHNIEGFIGDQNALALQFSDVDVAWIRNFESYLLSRGVKHNTIRLYMSDFQSLFNNAIREGAITIYPFKMISFTKDKTRKRSLSVDLLARMFTLSNLSRKEQFSVDIFRLSFCLLGINVKDLYCLKKSDITGDRIYYKRAKTGSQYEVKIHPSSQRLIDKYKASEDSEYYLCFADEYRFDYFHQKIARGLNAISDRMELGIRITSYYARHSWATIASELDIPKETISHALGHSQSSVTDIYINYDMRKVDEANARVLSVLESKILLSQYDDVKPVSIEDCPF